MLSCELSGQSNSTSITTYVMGALRLNNILIINWIYYSKLDFNFKIQTSKHVHFQLLCFNKNYRRWVLLTFQILVASLVCNITTKSLSRIVTVRSSSLGKWWKLMVSKKGTDIGMIGLSCITQQHTIILVRWTSHDWFQLLVQQLSLPTVLKKF